MKHLSIPLVMVSSIIIASPSLAEETMGLDRIASVQPVKVKRERRSFDSNGNVIGGAPAGCPSTQFCGCAVSIKVFGRNVRSLWQARAWFRFPKTYAQEGAVAVTSRHVFLLLSHVEGTRWLAYDPNSGGHKTRIHERDIRGTTIVDPRGSKFALN